MPSSEFEKPSHKSEVKLAKKLNLKDLGKIARITNGAVDSEECGVVFIRYSIDHYIRFTATSSVFDDFVGIKMGEYEIPKMENVDLIIDKNSVKLIGHVDNKEKNSRSMKMLTISRENNKKVYFEAISSEDEIPEKSELDELLESDEMRILSVKGKELAFIGIKMLEMLRQRDREFAEENNLPKKI